MNKRMEIVILRHFRLGKALHGRLLWDGQYICDTLENADTCLPVGEYELRSWRDWFVPSNGPYALSCGKIAVGTCRHFGFLVRTQESYMPLVDRVRKALARHHVVTVTIREDGDDYKDLNMFFCLFFLFIGI